MHERELKMAFFKFLQMVMHLRKLLENGLNLQMNLVMLGFHWQVIVLIHLERFDMFTQCGLFLLSTITFLLACQ
jgi:hypothetical protein